MKVMKRREKSKVRPRSDEAIRRRKTSTHTRLNFYPYSCAPLDVVVLYGMTSLATMQSVSAILLILCWIIF
jgi:hypothetical protein